jgi:hypothetical protein
VAVQNGKRIACVGGVMYGMFLNPSASSGVLTTWRLAPSSASRLGSLLVTRLIKKSVGRDVGELEPFPSFLRLIR